MGKRGEASQLLGLRREAKSGAMFLFAQLFSARQKPRARPEEISRQGNYRKAIPFARSI
ncbi:MAG: hypothetical protein LBM71_06065 [Elusimicrobiota bacterium]|jgi:hypothetical protein|nr:hypothetical protein [Elusimicrobiota bacterium]